MARMRTIVETMEHIKRLDPDTAITMHALRRMALTNEIPTVNVGKKILINIDALEKHFDSEVFSIQPSQQGESGIRSLPERFIGK